MNKEKTVIPAKAAKTLKAVYDACLGEDDGYEMD